MSDSTNNNPTPLTQSAARAGYDEGAARFSRADQMALTKATAVADSLSGGSFGPLKSINAWIIMVLSGVTMTIEVFTRHQFGERYLTTVRVALGIVTMVLFGFVVQFSKMYDGEISLATLNDFVKDFLSRCTIIDGLYYAVAVFGVGGLAIVHGHTIRRRNNAGRIWYSYSFGLSNAVRLSKIAGLLRRFSEWSIYRFIEPAVVFLIGVAISFIPLLDLFAVWLVLGGAMLFIRNNTVYLQQRSLQLDVIDSHLIFKYIDPIMQGVEPEQTAGYAGIPLTGADNVLPDEPASAAQK